MPILNMPYRIYYREVNYYRIFLQLKITWRLLRGMYDSYGYGYDVANASVPEFKVAAKITRDNIYIVWLVSAN